MLFRIILKIIIMPTMNNMFWISGSVFRSLIKILHCVSKDTLCITFYPKVHQYDFEISISEDVTKLKKYCIDMSKKECSYFFGMITIEKNKST